jgi:hypothetical protein
MPPWSNGKNGKEYSATMGRKAIAARHLQQGRRGAVPLEGLGAVSAKIMNVLRCQ